jgi:hypothetical protein
MFWLEMNKPAEEKNPQEPDFTATREVVPEEGFEPPTKGL